MAKKPKYNRFGSFIILFVIVLLSGCSQTKYVSDKEYLLGKNTVVVDNKEVNKEEIKNNIRQKENLRILGVFKFHLMLYNLSSKSKDNGVMKRIGEAPVIYDDYFRLKSVSQIEQYMHNKGYYDAEVSSEVSTLKRKAYVTYLVKANQPYKIRNFKYTIKDENLKRYYDQWMSESLVHSGDLLDVDVLNKERERITNDLNNDGYFNFVEDYIHFSIDSSLYQHIADIDMVVESAKSPTDPSKMVPHRIFMVDDYIVAIDNYKKTADLSKPVSYGDTVKTDGFSFVFDDVLLLKKSLITNSIEQKPGTVFSKKNEDKTYNNLYGLRQFKYVNIQYQEVPSTGDSLMGHLTGHLHLPMQTKQSYGLDIEGTNTSGDLGVAGTLNYEHKNLFRGGQIFDLTFRGARERQTHGLSGQFSEFNMKELGAEAKITFPSFVFPFNVRHLDLYSKPQTQFSTTYNYQERPDYTRTIANATFGYQWKTSAEYSHYLAPINLNVINISRIDSSWLNSIEDLFIKSSYTDHVIASLSYSMVFNNQNAVKKPSYHYLKVNFEMAGNLLWAISHLTDRPKYTNNDSDSTFITSYYRIFNTRFAQYIKGDADFRYGYRFDDFNAVACRVFLGVGFPYGNFNVMPFEKRYYTGGANGIRAWQVRSLGPGSYSGGADDYPNQSADIKIEANIEYRFKLVWLFEGALFFDTGNIWAINNTDNREGAVFHFGQFYQEFAVGTGMGLRLVTPYFIARFDWGVKLRDPSLDLNNRWIIASRVPNASDTNFNIAIGYPF